MWPVRWHGVINAPPRKPEHASSFESADLRETSAAAKASRPEPSVQRQPELPIVPAPVCASQPFQAEYPAPVSPIQPPMPPEWLREQPRPAAENAEPAQEPAPSEPASRMERLRELFENVGLANLQRNYGPRPQDEPLPMQRAVATRSLEMPTEPPSIVRVAATDETLLPREFIPVREPERTSDETISANPRDEIRILPSKRGQYGSR
jgi:hypothetical protein